MGGEAPASAACVTVLGSGTLLPDHRRHSAAHLVETAEARVLLDCGLGTVHGLSAHGVAWTELTHVCVTHYHTDHVGDLPALMFALEHGVRPARSDPLVLAGPPDFGDWLERLAAATGGHVLDPGFDVVVAEVGDGAVHDGPDFRLSASPTPHTDESVAYRLDGSWGSVGYTGDTGPSEAVAAFLAGTGALVCECALTDPPQMDLHLSPRGVAELARVADPELLVLTHVYPPLTHDAAAVQVSAAGYGGRVVAGVDGMRVSIESGTVAVAPDGTSV